MEYMTIKQVAASLAIPEPTIYSRIQRNKLEDLPRFEVVAGRYLFTSEAVKNWKESQQ